MARTMLYHKQAYPMGKVFDTETNKPDPHISTAEFGSVDSPDKMYLTRDDLIEVVVKQELAKQSSDRPEIEKAYEKRTGQKAHYGASDKTLIKVVDKR